MATRAHATLDIGARAARARGGVALPGVSVVAPLVPACGVPVWVWSCVLAVNVATLLAFGHDKWRAARGGRRVPEARLLWATFCCGCIGAWIGMQWFRHKTRKTSFRWRAIALTVINPLWLLCWMQFG